MEHKKVTFIYDENDNYLAVENVPAQVCLKCGEKTYSPDVVNELTRYAQKDYKPMKIVEMPVFDFAEHHK